ncbi:MAG TPA: leucyl aminopeptidase family protein [Woeseiaceae bacterium]|nr:leucyl aminopeptidase family protein [Woeseiaceae bacterium]
MAAEMEHESLASMYTKGQEKSRIKITQVTAVPTGAAIASLDQLLVVLPEKVPSAAWRNIPQGNKVQALMRRRSPGNAPAVRTRINNKRQSLLLVGTVAAKGETFDLLSFARKMVAAAASEPGGNLGILVTGFSDDHAERITSHLTTAALASAFNLAEFKTKAKPQRISSIRILGLRDRVDLSRVEAEARGNNLARWLTAMPPNKLDAAEYIAFLRKLSKEYGWRFKKYGVRELESMGAGAFLAVAQGNQDQSAGIVRLQYRPAAATDTPAVSLVGKGIIFDTGGNNLKPFLSMADMHIDMGGSAVAAGALLAMTELGYPHAVDCWMPITENRIGPGAYKSQDVITAANGKTIEVVHTDAEGRLALADALVFACREKPRLIIDYATLTGACINAITRGYSGVFTNRPDWHPILKKSGRDSGERVWPFPQGKEFLDELESEVADIKQCTPEAGGDHILAATFLNEFVDSDIPWIHVDLSASKRKGGLGAIATDITGFGVSLTMDLVMDKQLPDPPDTR